MANNNAAAVAVMMRVRLDDIGKEGKQPLDGQI